MKLFDLLKTLNLRQEILIAQPHSKYKGHFLSCYRGEVTEIGDSFLYLYHDYTVTNIYIATTDKGNVLQINIIKE